MNSTKIILKLNEGLISSYNVVDDCFSVKDAYLDFLMFILLKNLCCLKKLELE